MLITAQRQVKACGQSTIDTDESFETNVPITVDRQIRGGRHTDALIMTDENRQKTADKHKNIDRKMDRQALEKTDPMCS